MKRITLTPSLAEDVILQACSVLSSGGVVVIPTDTVYGLAVDATNAQAVEKLLAFKALPQGQGLAIFVSDIHDISQFCSITPEQQALAETLLPGPYTIVLPSKHVVVNSLEAENGTLGIRVPEYPFIHDLVERFGKPLTATSASLAGSRPSYNIDSLLSSLSHIKKDAINLIIDGGKLPTRQPSTVINLAKDEIAFERRGDTILKIKSWISHTPHETRTLAHTIFKTFCKDSITTIPVVLLFEGPMGVGKTVFTKGIGECVGVKETINSPTFTIVNEYMVSDGLVKRLFHLDLYRLEESSEFSSLGIEEMLTAGSLICIEWGEKSGPILAQLKKKADVILIQMKYKGEQEREISLVKIGIKDQSKGNSLQFAIKKV